MRAAVLPQIGMPLELRDVPDPVPAAGDVVVKVLAAPVLSYALEVFSGERD